MDADRLMVDPVAGPDYFGVSAGLPHDVLLLSQVVLPLVLALTAGLCGE